MAQVQGIVFTDDAHRPQKKALLFPKNFISGVENLVNMKYNMVSMVIIPQMPRK
jgi:hypothetical protein